MQPAGRTTVMLGDEATGIRLVANGRIAELFEKLQRRLAEIGGCAGAIPITDDEIGLQPATGHPDIAGHGMAVDQDAKAEHRMRPGDQPAKAGVIGLVAALDPLHGDGQRHPALVDLHVFSDDARDRAKPTGDARRIAVGKRRQRIGKHPGIELIGLSVDIDIGAREMRDEQRRAQPGRRREQLIDEMVFRPADRDIIESRLIQKGRRVSAAAMRGIIDEGNGLDRGLSNLEQLEFVGHPLPRASSLPSHKLVVSAMLPVGRCKVHTPGNGGAGSLFRCSPVLY